MRQAFWRSRRAPWEKLRTLREGFSYISVRVWNGPSAHRFHGSLCKVDLIASWKSVGKQIVTIFWRQKTSIVCQVCTWSWTLWLRRSTIFKNKKTKQQQLMPFWLLACIWAWKRFSAPQIPTGKTHSRQLELRLPSPPNQNGSAFLKNPKMRRRRWCCGMKKEKRRKSNSKKIY